MDLDKIKTLLDYMGRSRVTELRVTQDGTTVVIRNSPRIESEAVTSDNGLGTGLPRFDDGHSNSGESGTVVRAPTSGIVHAAASPGAAPLATLNGPVELGQGLCVLEAMKVFTTVPAPIAGTLARLLFEDGQEVSAGDPLLEIVE